MGDLTVVYIEADDLDTMFAGLGSSQDPFDVWSREQTREVHGVDSEDGVPAPELLMSFKAAGASPLPQPELVCDQAPVGMELVFADSCGDGVQAVLVDDRRPSGAVDKLVIEPRPQCVHGAWLRPLQRLGTGDRPATRIRKICVRDETDTRPIAELAKNGRVVASDAR
jgi:hypothetical protein